MSYIDFEQFSEVDIRVGRIISVEAFPEARKPAYKLTIDFGSSIGTKRSSAQITDNYSPDDLVGKLVLAVCNLRPKRIAGFVSEVLVLGVPDENNNVVLVSPDKEVPIGGKLY
ncbi:export-related chaperone CsaA [Thermobaculum terrenum ATCC BAA-798]|uniref:Export-related chaperone CsaA n=1 Tax=Thermobaculum terrenum (strain ATCC BAA-798 / CCMEE 7001 / YNP1) TaxID=525904 RepID=D1CG30_THET1|nr:tRNA-binding protein [Thermobaculum terrenum]ACZ41886.1 export-related chaperone CsaA [Thermobaculum terrenum ATCC BAA-798]